MKARAAFLVRIITLGPWLLAAAGCSLLPEPKADPTRFYLLSSPASAVEPAAGASVVQLQPVELAGYLRSPPMIVRRGDNEIEFREYARWGEPLEQGIARVLRETLRARGLGVTIGSARENPAADYQLVVRVLACEGATGGAVDFRAVWSLTRKGAGSAPAAGGEFRAEGLRWDGKTEGALAAQLSQAVSALAAEIAGAWPKG